MSALERLQAERKALLKEKPLGFFAKPKKNIDGTKNYFEWECGIPGKESVGMNGCTKPLCDAYRNAVTMARWAL
eukprot:m.69830 g.69830  ORF g.69830 m.69830 type:complete len:74 (-) comp14144_c0_seq6:3500-3721(-)